MSDLDKLFRIFQIIDSESVLAEYRRELVLDFLGTIPNSIIKSVDFEKGSVITDLYDANSNSLTEGIFDTSYFIFEQIDKTIRKVKKSIDKDVSTCFRSYRDVEIVLKNYDLIVCSYLNRNYSCWVEKEIIHNGLKELIAYLAEKYNYVSHCSSELSSQHKVVDNYTPLSYTWISADSKTAIRKVSMLFKMLTEEPPIIGCSESDFISAFTSRKLEYGIKWLVIGKNNQTSKLSLIHFIEKLISERFIHEKSNSSFNASLAYVFRDAEGNLLKNISVSKSQGSGKPAESDRIEGIISQLS